MTMDSPTRVSGASPTLKPCLWPFLFSQPTGVAADKQGRDEEARDA